MAKLMARVILLVIVLSALLLKIPKRLNSKSNVPHQRAKQILKVKKQFYPYQKI